ncbi:MAG TPA: DUF4212 domain-containing protein [bacterium]|nr:DUF4212 domain-containing protein [bacterium]HPP86246.1 DUF4212 domain-containing protein [bacterium]
MKEEKQNKNYSTNFFKPSSEFARRNRNIVIAFIIIWAVAVFGFQIVLKFFEKPKPEHQKIVFDSVWQNIQSGAATPAEKQQYISTLLSALGKSINKKEKTIAAAALNNAVFEILSEEDKIALIDELNKLSALRAELQKSSDKISVRNSIREKNNAVVKKLSVILNLNENSVSAQLLPYYLSATPLEISVEEIKNELPKIMDKYFIHNRSFLTDTKFINFPFHYWYTAEFLLVLFLLLCLSYCFFIDKLNKQYSIEEN